MKSQAALPLWMSHDRSVWMTLATSLAGAGLLTLLAQVSIRLPWTPVPMTGQTFGIALIGLTWGGYRGFLAAGLYLLLGAVGFPVFAGAQSGLSIGPTLGYLLGMWIACSVDGALADRGWTNSYWKALLTSYVGSAIIFASGLLVLSQYVPKENLLSAGLYPFLLGDLIKNLLASGIARSLRGVTRKWVNMPPAC